MSALNLRHRLSTDEALSLYAEAMERRKRARGEQLRSSVRDCLRVMSRHDTALNRWRRQRWEKKARGEVS
jgi:hypothetical protein